MPFFDSKSQAMFLLAVVALLTWSSLGIWFWQIPIHVASSLWVLWVKPDGYSNDITRMTTWVSHCFPEILLEWLHSSMILFFLLPVPPYSVHLSLFSFLFFFFSFSFSFLFLTYNSETIEEIFMEISICSGSAFNSVVLLVQSRREDHVHFNLLCLLYDFLCYHDDYMKQQL